VAKRCRAGQEGLLDQHVSGREGATLGADAGYDVADFVAALRTPNGFATSSARLAPPAAVSPLESEVDLGLVVSRQKG